MMRYPTEGDRVLYRAESLGTPRLGPGTILGFTDGGLAIVQLDSGHRVVSYVSAFKHQERSH